MQTKPEHNAELLAAGVHSSYVDPDALSYNEVYDDYCDEHDYTDEAPTRPRVEPVKPSAYVPGTRPNWLREKYTRMASLSQREGWNIPHKLFKGIRLITELPGEETPRNHIVKTQTANGLRRSSVNGKTFYSRRDLLYYAKEIARTYEDFELMQGENQLFYMTMLLQAGYINEDVRGAVFFAPFKTKFAERVLCFINETDEIASAEFLDVVVRRVPATPIAPAEVPAAFYRGKRRGTTKEKREERRREQAEHTVYLAQKAADTQQIKAATHMRNMLKMGLDPVALAKQLLDAHLAPASPAPPLPDAFYQTDGGYDENFFDGIEDLY